MHLPFFHLPCVQTGLQGSEGGRWRGVDLWKKKNKEKKAKKEKKEKRKKRKKRKKRECPSQDERSPRGLERDLDLDLPSYMQPGICAATTSAGRSAGIGADLRRDPTDRRFPAFQPSL